MGSHKPHPPQNIPLDDFVAKAVLIHKQDSDFCCPVCGKVLLREKQPYEFSIDGRGWLRKCELTRHIQLHHWKSECLDQYYMAMVLGDF